MQDYIIPLITLILGGTGATGWLHFRQKKRAISSEIAADEFEDVATMVDNYIHRVAKMSGEISKLHDEIQELQRIQHHLQSRINGLVAENENLKTELEKLRGNGNHANSQKS